MVSAPAVPNPVFQLIVSQLEAAAMELFDAYRIAVRKSEVARGVGASASEPSNLAVVGFVGEGIRGSLVMVARESSVLAWLEAMGETSADCADVLGEFANMLLGRLKTRLIPEGLPVQISTPTTGSGNLRLSIPPVLSKWLVLEGEDWELRIRIDTTFEPQFALRERRSTEAAPAQAGEAIFF